METKSLAQIYGVTPSLGNPIDYLDSAQDKYGEIKTFLTKYKNPVGIELEIENVPSTFQSSVHSSSIYWRKRDEGSLKNAGAEFASFPLSGQNIDYALYEFSQHAKGYEFDYSVRTSTHVHVNVSYMNYEELVSLVLCSALVEPLLYSLCSEERRGSPYCYSIADLIPEEALTPDPDLKYCGINIAPVRTQLSVEYRQLHGTNDWRLVRRWIQILSKLYYYAKMTPGKKVRDSIRLAIKTNDVSPLLKRILGASIVLFPDPSICKKNYLWLIAAIDFAENL